MTQQYDDTNRGAAFPNRKKTPGDKRPEWTGELDVEGKKYWLSLWQKRSKAGNPYYSASVQSKEDQQQAQPAFPSAQPSQTPVNHPQDLDDSIPF
jgi:hypothetical protein